jgi:putative ABC transport system permease protein
MFLNYLRIALRFLKKNKVFAIINLFSLSIALAVSFIIILFIVNELSYDECHRNRKVVFRVINHFKDFNKTLPSTPFPLAETLIREFPQVKNATNIRNIEQFSIYYNENEFKVGNTLATDSGIFNIFTFNIILKNNSNNLLGNRNSICLSHALAEKLNSNIHEVIGKEIEAIINNEKQILTITAIFENIPVNSILRADCLLNSYWEVEDVNKSFEIKNSDKSWTHNFWTTWVLVQKDADMDILDNQLRTIENKYLSENPNQNYALQNLSDVYLKSNDISNSGIKGDMKTIRLCSVIAILIILIAAINYIILSNIVSSARTKEIGIRKTNGATQQQIRNQFLIESLLLALIVLPIALCFMFISLEHINRIIETQIPIISSNIILYLVIYFVLILLIGIASGLYTSIHLARLNVMDILKPTLFIGKKKNIFRSSLIIIQLIVFIFFLSCALIIHSQYKYTLAKNPGFNNQNVLFIDIDNFNIYNSILDELKANTNVIMVSGAMSGIPISFSMSAMYSHFQNTEQKVKVEEFCIDYDFLKTMGIPLKEGRDFSRDFGGDFSNSCIINETAVKQLGILDPINKRLGPYAIIGVVKDFNLHSFHTDIAPLMLTLTDEYIGQIIVNYKSGSLDKLTPVIKTLWSKVNQEKPFRYFTIEQFIKELYSEEKKMSIIISVVTLFVMLIASSGLFGLTLFIAKSRTKEIGLRKVFGSSGTSIIYSFLKTNFFYILMSSVISIPITILVMSDWLNNYSFKIEIKWWFFVIAFSISVIIVLLTVFIHSYKASRINPIDVLRYE